MAYIVVGVGRHKQRFALACFHAGFVLHELHQFPKFRAAAGEHNAGIEPVGVARFLDFILHGLDNFGHAGFNSLGQRTERHFAAARSRHPERRVFLNQITVTGAVLHFQLFGIARRNGAPIPDVFGNYVSAERDNGHVAHHVIIVNHRAGGAGANVDHRHAHILIVVAQHGFGRSERRQKQPFQTQPRTLNTALDKFHREFVGRQYGKFRLQQVAANALKLLGHDAGAVDMIHLRNDVEHLAAGVYEHIAHVVFQTVDFVFRNFLSVVDTPYFRSLFSTLDMPPGNAHIHLRDVDVRLLLQLVYKRFQHAPHFRVVQHLAMRHAMRGRFEMRKNMNFPGRNFFSC